MVGNLRFNFVDFMVNKFQGLNEPSKTIHASIIHQFDLHKLLC